MLAFEVELTTLDQLDQFRNRGVGSSQETGDWMHAFSEILTSPPCVRHQFSRYRGVRKRSGCGGCRSQFALQLGGSAGREIQLDGVGAPYRA